MADHKKHKYIRKVPTKTGGIRYIYADSRSAKWNSVGGSAKDLVNSVGTHAKDETTKKFTETTKQKQSRRQRQQNDIIEKGKKLVEKILEPLPQYR